MAESHAADDTSVMERVDQINVKHAGDVLVEDADPIFACLLVVGRNLVNVEFAQNTPRLGMVVHAAVLRCGVADLWRLSGARVGDGSIDLGCGRANRGRGPSHSPP